MATDRRRPYAPETWLQRIGAGPLSGDVFTLGGKPETALLLGSESTSIACCGGDREAPGPGALRLDHLHNGDLCRARRAGDLRSPA
jgi:hypothetical protein